MSKKSYKNNLFDFSQSIQDIPFQFKFQKVNKIKFFNNSTSKQNIDNSLHKSQLQSTNQIQQSNKSHIIKKFRKRNSWNPIKEIQENKYFNKGKIIKGQWKDQKLNGNVEIQYFNGNKFIGTYNNGLRIQGIMQYSDANCQYNGQFCGQKFSGYGKLTYYNGRSIEGQWNDMDLIGKALITYPNNDVYYGRVDDKLFKHGQGHLFLQNGQKYIGCFQKGSITGKGVYIKKDGQMIRGLWKKGKLIVEYKDDDLMQYTGFIGTNNVKKTSKGRSSIQQNINKFTGHILLTENESINSPVSSKYFLKTQQSQSNCNENYLKNINF